MAGQRPVQIPAWAVEASGEGGGQWRKGQGEHRCPMPSQLQEKDLIQGPWQAGV